MTGNPWRIVIASALLGVISATASAQLLGVSTTVSGLGVMPNACATTQSHASVATNASADWALGRASWTGAVASNGGAARTNELYAQLLTPEWHGWRADLAGAREGGDVECAGRSTLRSYSGGLSFGWERSGISLRYHKRITRNGAFSRDTLAEQLLGPTTRGLSIAAWHNMGRALVVLSVGSRSRWREERQQLFHEGGRRDTIPSDSGPVIITIPGPWYETRWNRAMAHSFGSELQLAWARGRFAFNGLAGHSLGGSTLTQGRMWGSSEATLALTPAVALVGGYVVEDTWATHLPSARRYFTLGARLTSAAYSKPPDVDAPARAVASAFRFAVDDNGTVTLSVRSNTARLVEVTGDFVQWRAVRMQRIAADWWQLRAPMSRGVHRINVRVDGGKWNAPPGLPRQRDEYGGEAGVLTIP